MGMSIDEAKRNLSYAIKWKDRPTDESMVVAIETMRKYQKIVDIVSMNGEEFKQCGLKELKEILEVIADGNKNNHHASNC